MKEIYLLFKKANRYIVSSSINSNRQYSKIKRVLNLFKERSQKQNRKGFKNNQFYFEIERLFSLPHILLFNIFCVWHKYRTVSLQDIKCLLKKINKYSTFLIINFNQKKRQKREKKSQKKRNSDISSNRFYRNCAISFLFFSLRDYRPLKAHT